MNKKTKKIIWDAILLALLCVTSLFEIPIGSIPFTFQILVVLIIALSTDLSSSMVIIIVYIVMGLIGLPVFAGGTSGLVRIYSLSFGFIIGFIPMAIVIHIFKKIIKTKNKYVSYILSSLCGVLIDYVFGFIYILIFGKVLQIFAISGTVFQILLYSIIIFIPFDITKIIIAVIISKRLENII